MFNAIATVCPSTAPLIGVISFFLVGVAASLWMSRYNRLQGRGNASLPNPNLPNKPILQIELARNESDIVQVLKPNEDVDLDRNLRDARIGNNLDTFLFIPAYAGFLIGVGLLLAGCDEPWRTFLLAVALLAVPLAAICDWLENRGISRALDHFAQAPAHGPRPGDAARISTPSRIKWTLLALILLLYGVASLRELRFGHRGFLIIATLALLLGASIAYTLFRYFTGHGVRSPQTRASSFHEVLKNEEREIGRSRPLRLAHHIVAVLDPVAQSRPGASEQAERLRKELARSYPALTNPEDLNALVQAFLKSTSPEERCTLIGKLANTLDAFTDDSLIGKRERFGTVIARNMNWPLDVFPEQNANGPRRDWLGLAFSGGGIRSATFNLGVLQGIAELGWLHCVDYLSTVSGGGYIGAWVAAWLSRQPLSTVENALKPEQNAVTPRQPVAPGSHEFKPIHEIQFLREYSNYLTPQVGAFTPDTWTMIAIYLRNTVLNLTILIAGLAAMLLVPRIALKLGDYLGTVRGTTGALLALFGLLVATIVIALNLSWFQPERKAEFYTHQKWVQCLVLAPTFFAAYVGTARFVPALTAADGCWSAQVLPSALTKLFPPVPCEWETSVAVGLALTVLLFVLEFAGGFYACYKSYRSGSNQGWRSAWGILLLILYPFISGLILGTLLTRGALGLLGAFAAQSALPKSLIWGIPFLIVVVLSGVVVLHVGLMGRNLPDDRREWLGRVGAWLMICSLGWVALFGVSIYGPELLLWGIGGIRSYLTSAAVLAWIGMTLKGVFIGKSSVTTGPTSTSATHATGTGALIAKAAPFVFIGGLFLALSLAIHVLLVRWWCPGEQWGSFILLANHWTFVQEISRSWGPLVLLLIFAFIALGLSLTVDINEFSMHHFYKNRLVRCYLGASHPDRKPNPFTGFDSDDDVHLATLRASDYAGPYPIICSTLNLVKGDDLAWQERKGTSFALTPQYCGFEVDKTNANQVRHKAKPQMQLEGFRPTSKYAYSNGGIHLGTAVSISGAAANPNMGSDSSPALSFLLTVFNVRLGWWLGNPRWDSKWQMSSPGLGLTYLAKELFGLTDDKAGFVDLSDGGHFENLGIYELVRRHCSFIVACDAEEDAQLTFGGLGNAIRKCRADFGADIQIDVSRLRRDPATDRSQSHCVVGKIVYNDGTEGKLLYLKASLTGDEPTDVLEYDSREPAFPHQSTADQWFDESQFESYRKLGIHIAQTTFSPVQADNSLNGTKEAFFEALEEAWYPPSTAIEKSFTKHAEAYDALIERLRKDPGLAFLDDDFFPGFLAILNKPPRTDAERRSSFYFCNSLIQLMENVYVDLKLQSQSERNHPYNQGWIDLFQQWARSPALIEAWKVSANTYGIQFRKFCEQTLGLK